MQLREGRRWEKRGFFSREDGRRKENCLFMGWVKKEEEEVLDWADPPAN